MRKIETINRLKNLGLKVAEAREFKASEMKDMLSFANHLIGKYGTFNLRTDTPKKGRAGINLPFIMNCSISKLISLIKEHGDQITYIVHQHFELSNQLFNGTVRLCDGMVIGEINDIDKTSQRAGLLNAVNLKQVCSNQGIFDQIKQDLTKANEEAWFELTAYKNGEIVYWQIVQEAMTEHLKSLFFK